MSHNVYSTLGASNHSARERQNQDLYCTHPDAVHALMKLEQFSPRIWEPCDGLGHISDTLKQYGYIARRSDLFTRGRDIEQLDFLNQDELWEGDIITNPPYSCATAFVRKAIETVADGHKVAMWLRILYLESLERNRLFSSLPPEVIYISSKRIPCAMNGDFKHFSQSAQGYMWVIWRKGYKGKTVIKWFI